MTTAADTFFGGRYRLVSRIARGGMGEVWRASDELLQRPVAIKLLREDLIGDSGFIGRFRAEARNTAVLSHPGIAQLHDYGEQGGRAYLVMELVPGDPLSWILARDGAIEPTRALRYAGQAALALQVAHDAGVIHRDVKPANLIVTPNEQVKITDFGIAKAIGDGTLTGTGQVMGTAEYLSPEQAIGNGATPLSDIYALGIVLYECLAGRRPFANGNPVKIALAQVHETPPPLPQSVPNPVQELVGRLLAKDPTSRPAGGGALAREIATLLSVEGPLQAIGSNQGSLLNPVSGSRAPSTGEGARRAAAGSAHGSAATSDDAALAGASWFTTDAHGEGNAGPASADPNAGSAPDAYGSASGGPASAEAYGTNLDSSPAQAETAEVAGNHRPGSAHYFHDPSTQLAAGWSAPPPADAPTIRVAASDRAEDDSGEHSRATARTAKLQDLTARPTGRRRAPRRNGLDFERVLAYVGTGNRRLIVIATLVAVIAALAGFALGKIGQTEPDSQPSGITVPLVRGKPIAQARQELADRGLGVFVTYTLLSSAEPDTVTDQDPAASVMVEEGTVVHLTVASSSASALPRATGPPGYRLEMDAAHHIGGIPGTVAEVVHAGQAVGDPCMPCGASHQAAAHQAATAT